MSDGPDTATSNAIGSSCEAITVRTACAREAMSGAVNRIVFDDSGIGDSLKVALTIAARLPNDPATSLERS